jgi:nitrate reductase gamma subunit
VTTQALFAVAPYAAASSLAALTLLRFVALRRRGRGRQDLGLALRVFRGNRLWRVGLAATLAGHLAVLFLPQMVLRWTASLPRLIAFEVASLACGLAAAAGLVTVLSAHLRQRTHRSARFVADGVVLALLAVAIGSGLGVAVVHRWATSWSLVTVAPYVRSVLALSPDLDLVAALPYLVKLHIFSALACAAVLPLSHALDPILIHLGRLLAAVRAPVDAATRWAWTRADDAARRAAHAFWWREEEE